MHCLVKRFFFLAKPARYSLAFAYDYILLLTQKNGNITFPVDRIAIAFCRGRETRYQHLPCNKVIVSCMRSDTVIQEWYLSRH